MLTYGLATIINFIETKCCLPVNICKKRKENLLFDRKYYFIIIQYYTIQYRRANNNKRNLRSGY
jgi:hypothetical protein